MNNDNAETFGFVAIVFLVLGAICLCCYFDHLDTVAKYQSQPSTQVSK